MISLIICSRNRAGPLAATLAALDLLAGQIKVPFELLVVDNASSDQTQKTIVETTFRFLRPKYVFCGERGLSNARHAGIDAAKGSIIAFLDDDVRPEANWLDELVEPLIDQRADITTGNVKIAAHLQRPWMTGLHKVWLAAPDTLPINPETVTGANFAFRREVLKKVPRFDNELGAGRLGFWEDTLFAKQAKQAGYRIMGRSNSRMEHHFDSDRLLRRAFLARADGEGKSIAYISWHWDHNAPIPRRSLLLLRKQARLAILRSIRRNDITAVEGAPEWELSLVQTIGYLKQHGIEEQRTRNYTRHGLSKLTV